jgi:hypothetical protein
MNGSNENGNCNSLLKEPVLVYIFEAIISNLAYPDEDLLLSFLSPSQCIKVTYASFHIQT